MNLHNALRISPGQAAALVGAGGKSSAASTLVTDLEGEMPIVVTTTTHLGVDQSGWTRRHIVGCSTQDKSQLLRAMEKAASVLVTGPLNTAGDKWTGLDQAALRDLRNTTIEHGGLLLIEADGARRRWIKAPAEHEPVIPTFADLVVPVVGLHAWGKALGDEIAHRPELLAERLGIVVGDRLHDEHFTAWAVDDRLALKGIPAGASVRILINQVDSQLHMEAARRIAAGCLDQSQVEAVILANVGREPERLECIGRVAGVVLAAGGSSRAEDQKLLYSWRGKPLVRHVVEKGLEAGLQPLVVVLGADADAIRGALADLPVVFTHNPDWKHGQSTSLRFGLNSIDLEVEGVVFLLGDMPLVTIGLIQEVMQAHRGSLAPIAAPWANERWGNPVLFDRVTLHDLKKLDGDRGGRHLYDRYSILPVPAGQEALFDCDTNEDLKWLTTHYP